MRIVEGLREQVERELLGDILPYWLNYAVDHEFGGFRGQIANDLTIDPLAHKGLILNARILWTFAKAYQVYRGEVYLNSAAGLRISAALLLGRRIWRRVLDGGPPGEPGGDEEADLRSGLHRLRAGGIRGGERGKGTARKSH